MRVNALKQRTRRKPRRVYGALHLVLSHYFLKSPPCLQLSQLEKSGLQPIQVTTSNTTQHHHKPLPFTPWSRPPPTPINPEMPPGEPPTFTIEPF